jgi:hypothetical protein
MGGYHVALLVGVILVTVIIVFTLNAFTTQEVKKQDISMEEPPIVIAKQKDIKEIYTSIQSKVLVLYVYHQVNDSVLYFIKNGIFYNPNIDFIVISNNGKIDVPLPKYVQTVKRANRGYDFGAWSDVLLEQERYKKYDYYIFVNASCIGPFVPFYYPKTWCDIFIDSLNEVDRLFGSTINNSRNPYEAHVQTWAFTMGKEALQVAIDAGVFSKDYPLDKDSIIRQCEVGLSRAIINHGWNIRSTLVAYQGVDFRFIDKKPEEYKNVRWELDVAFSGAYFGMDTHPFEVIFVKSCRNMKVNELYLRSIRRF